MSDKPLRAGIIGLGIGAAHAKGYAGNHGAELVALCDLDEQRLRDLSRQYNVPDKGCYSDYRKMLAEAKLDIVSVCLPNSMHAEAAIAALEAGTHVLCEKPMAPSVSQARQMVDAATKANKQIMIAYNYRYRADVQWIHRMIKSGQLGQIYHVHAMWRRETGIPGSGWFGRKEMAGGGALIDLGVHVLDLTMWLLNFPMVKTVSGDTHMVFGQRGLKTWGHRPGQPIETVFDVDDGAVGFVRFGDSSNLVLEATWAEHRQPQDDMIHIELQGTEGTAVLNIANYRKDDTLRMYKEMEGEPVTVIPTIRWDGPMGHEALIIDTLACLRNGLPMPTDGAQGLMAVHVLEAMYRSSHEGREIELNQGIDVLG
ncbi:MAG: Gfo/Idh/MocA family oxidoreductase [Anaerolineae bacterium]|nr:Gfo/Idh/MocA family oxidoreductase [Anaerolineae bacterium]